MHVLPLALKQGSSGSMTLRTVPNWSKVAQGWGKDMCEAAAEPTAFHCGGGQRLEAELKPKVF